MAAHYSTTSPAAVFTQLEYGAGAPASSSHPYLGNGQLAIAVDGATANDAYETRLAGARTFDFTHLVPESGAATVSSRSLFMTSGVWKTESSTGAIDVTSSLTCLRYAGFAALQKVEVSVPTVLEHVVAPPPGYVVQDYTYRIDHIRGRTYHVLTVRASSPEGSAVYACMYPYTAPFALFEALGADVPAGTGTVRNRSSVASSLVVIHAVAHDTPASELMRGLVTLVENVPTGSDEYVSMMQTHSMRWSSYWMGRMAIGASGAATAAELDDIRTLNIHIRTALYRLYSDILDPGALKIVRRHTPLIEDVLLRAAILPISPWLLTYYVPETTNPWTPLYAVAHQVIDHWNQFRATQDRSTVEKNHDAWRASVDEVVTRVQLDPLYSPTAATVQVPAARTYDGGIVVNDAMTVAAVSRCLYAADQLSNATRNAPSGIWGDMRSQLVVPMTAGLQLTGTADAHNVMALHPVFLNEYLGSTDLGNQLMVLTANSPYVQATLAASADISITEACVAINVAEGRASGSASVTQGKCNASAIDYLATTNMLTDAEWGFAAATDTRGASSFMATLMYGFSDFKFQGFVSRTGVHTVPVQLTFGRSSLILPASWGVVTRYSSRTPYEQSVATSQSATALSYVCNC